jgi:hypothetical protein
LDFAFVPEFLAATSLLEPAEVCRTELKPLLTIFGTSMRAARVIPALVPAISDPYRSAWIKEVFVKPI